MENRGSFCLVVGFMSGQPRQWRQGLGPRDSARDQPCRYGSADAAVTLMRSRTYLGAQYRLLRTKLGAPKAIPAMAHRLARLVYRMLKYGQGYVDKGAEYYEQRYRRQQIEFLTKRATKLGLQITVAHA